MAVREFDGIDDGLTVSGTSLGTLLNGAFSGVLIVKPLTDPSDPDDINEGYWWAKSSGGTLLASINGHNSSNLGGLRYFTSAFDCSDFGDLVNNGEWYIIGWSKASATEFIRFHTKPLGAGSWIHRDGTGDTISATGTTIATMLFSANPSATKPRDMRLAAAALFNTELSDASFESIQTTPSTQKLDDLGAVALWEFNQASTATAVTDLTGGGANQTALTGTTVIEGDDPPGWTFLPTVPDSLLFAGGTDRRTFSPGNIAGTGALSVAAILKRTGSEAAYGWFCKFDLDVGTDSMPLGTIDGGSGAILATWNGGSERNADPTLPVLQNEWYLIGLSKATGIALPRYHIYRYSTSEWEHGNFDDTIGNYTAPDHIEWGFTSSESWVGNILIGAIWDSELSDATFETLEADWSSWITAAPDEAVRFNTAGTITPFVGISTLTTNSGGTLDVGDAPAVWSDGPTRTGTASQVNASGGDGSTSVTVPSDATGVVSFWAHWDGNIGSTLATLTLGGNTLFVGSGTQLQEIVDLTGIGVAYAPIAVTGSQTLAWTWSAGGARAEGGEIILVWVKNVDSARDWAVDQDTGSADVTVTIDSSSSDLVLAFAQRYDGSLDLNDATRFIDNGSTNLHTYDVGQIDAPGASTTVVTMTNESYSTMAAISLKAEEEEPEAVFDLLTHNVTPMRWR